MIAHDQSAEDISDWYYSEVSKLPLQRGDCPAIWFTTTGVWEGIIVQMPDQFWTKERAQDHLDIIREKLRKSGRL